MTVVFRFVQAILFCLMAASGAFAGGISVFAVSAHARLGLDQAELFAMPSPANGGCAAMAFSSRLFDASGISFMPMFISDPTEVAPRVLFRRLRPLPAQISNEHTSLPPVFANCRFGGMHADFEARLPRLKMIFEQEGIPAELVWLAEVESKCDPCAVSSAGAVGLFQLMPATARRFGLRTGLVDERVVPELNAAAAARYLKILHRQFGCWPLAIAAYNAGEGRVARLIQRHSGDTFHKLAAFLPQETRNFVPRVMITVALREDQLKNVPGSDWMPKREWKTRQ